VLQGYDQPDSFFGAGTGCGLSGSEASPPQLQPVVELATGILGRLGKTGNPVLRKSRPTVRNCSPSKTSAFFLPSHVAGNRPTLLVSPAAEMEIDARDGRVVDIHLWAHGHTTIRPRSRESSNRVYKPEHPPPYTQAAKSQARISGRRPQMTSSSLSPNGSIFAGALVRPREPDQRRRSGLGATSRRKSRPPCHRAAAVVQDPIPQRKQLQLCRPKSGSRAQMWRRRFCWGLGRLASPRTGTNFVGKPA
jgi:hypothetical protein